MDMQTKVVFITGKAPYEDVKELYIDENNYPGFDLNEEFFVFSEHTQVKVQLLSEEPSAYMALETYDQEEMTIIYPDGKEYIISQGGENKSMIVPGYYEINIYISDKVYHGFYKVEPSSISWEGLMKIRDFLEKLVSGLAQNLYLRKMGKQSEYVAQDRSLLEMYEHIVNNERMLMNNIDSLVKDPITIIEKKYRQQPYSKVPDMKSQKWLSKKGMTINSNVYVPEINYEKHSVLGLNTLENRWIKKIMHHTIYIIADLQKAYNKIMERINREINLKKVEYNDALSRYENTINDKLLSKRYKYQIEQRVKILGEEIKNYRKKADFIQRLLRNLKRIKAEIAHYEYETWFAEITGYEKKLKTSLKLVKEHRYFQIYTFYRKLLVMEKNRHGKKTSFPFKKTSLLFEYYTVVLVIDILESLGYKWEKGWLADSIDPMIFNGEIPRETEMVFRKDDVYLELVYDKEVGSEPDNPTKDQIVSINSTHTRPDIKITAYNDANKLLGCIIIEVKCSRSNYIYSGNGDTKVIEQIKDYMNFGHYDARSECSLPGGVNKVILVYPKQRFSITYPKYNFSFIQLDPADENNGCEELKEELRLVLNQF